MVETIQDIDQAITLWINSFYCGLTDQIWMFFSSKTVWIPFYVILVYIILKRLGYKRAIVVIAAILLTFLCCDQFSNIIKHAVGRLRPCYDENMLSGGLHILEKKGGLYGFYSSHAANCFGLAASSIIGFSNDKTHTYNSYKIWVYVWALLVSISRVFVGKHFLGDVLAGIFIGLLLGNLFGRLGNYIIGKFEFFSNPKATE